MGVKGLSFCLGLRVLAVCEPRCKKVTMIWACSKSWGFLSTVT